MEFPDETMFVGLDSGPLDANTQQRFEEEEALNDERRRHEEIGNLLTTAFDDLTDDDDIDSDINDSIVDDRPTYLGSIVHDVSAQHNHVNNGSTDAVLLDDRPTYLGSIVHGVSAQHSHGNNGSTDAVLLEQPDQNEEYRQTGFNSVKQLEILYEVRVREIERLTRENEKWQRRAMLLEAEQGRLQLSSTEQANLLVEAKSRIVDCETEAVTLKEKVLHLESANTLVSKDLEIYQATAADLQSQLCLLQRGNGPETFTDSLFRAAQQKHQLEVLSLQDQLQSATNKLALKTVDCENLLRRVNEVTKAQEELLVEKANTINKLSQSLDSSQKQINQLISSDEVLRRFEGSELLETWETDSIKLLGIGGKTTDNSLDQTTQLKDALKRCMSGYRLKSEEIKSLQQRVEEKDATITAMRNQESRLVEQINAFKEDASNIIEEFEYHNGRAMQYEAEKVLLIANMNELENRNTELQQKIEDNAVQRSKQLPTKNDNHSNDFLQFHDCVVSKIKQKQNEAFDEEICQLRDELGIALTENDRTKCLYIELCAAKDVLATELRLLKDEQEAYVKEKMVNEIELAKARANLESNIRENGLVEDLQSECILLRTNIEVLQAEIDAGQRLVRELKSQNEKEAQQKMQLLDRLNQIEQDCNLRNSSIQTNEGNLENEKRKLLKAFNDELKTKTQNHLIELKTIAKATREETKLLFVDKIKFMLNRQEHALKELGESNIKLQAAEEKVKEIHSKSEMADKCCEIALCEVPLNYEIQLSQLRESEEMYKQFSENCCTEFKEMREKYQKSLENWKSKYKSAKKLALDYKLFAENKERHLMSEWQRMKEGYETVLLEVQRKMASRPLN